MQISVFQLLETGNKYLLEKIIDLFLVFREEVADCIYRLEKNPYKFKKPARTPYYKKLFKFPRK